MFKSLLRIIECRGIQASGKTTWAKRQLDRYDNVARVNRDDLRAMLFMGNYNLNKEHLVKAVEQAAGQAVLEKSFNLIVDDTNLPPTSLWKELANLLGVKHTVRNFKVDVKTAIERDAQRPEPVGAEVIYTTIKRANKTRSQGDGS